MKWLFNILKKIPGIKGVVARYEAAFQQWGLRSWIQQTVQDARFDVDSSTRLELVRRHRYWVCNSSLVNRIRNLFIQFSVGCSGLQVIANSDDENWNEARNENWLQWCQEPELNSRLPMGVLTQQWAGALFDDGEVFIYLTQDERGKPKIVTLESQRVATPTDLKKEEGKNLFDGIRYDGNGKPVTYYVRVSQDPRDAYKPIDASLIIHLFKARRPGMLRGIPEGFSAMNTLHDYEDCKMLEMQVSKQAAQIGAVETNKTGEVDIANTRKTNFKIQTQDIAGNPVLKNGDQLYNVVFGSNKYTLAAGDTLKQFQVDRPSLTTQAFWDLTISDICCSYNVPKLLVVPYSLQGTVTRADLDICTNAFRVNFEIIAYGLRKVYEWQTKWANAYDRTMEKMKMPMNSARSVIRPPRAPNVDIGYTAKELALELELGTKTYQDVYAERQQDWRYQFRQIAESEAYISKLAKEFGIEPEQIANKLLQTQKSQPQEGKEEPETVP